VAASPRQAGHRPSWWLLGVTAVLVVVLAVTVVALLLRSPAPPATGATATRETLTPAPEQLTPSASPSPGAPQQPQRYRDYVSTAVTHGAALAGAISGLADCRHSRAECRQRIVEASGQVDEFQRALAANPAPACLNLADQRLHDGLSFERRGLDLAAQAVEARNRLKLAQGLLLVTVGTWREGQAIAAARHSNC